MTTTDSPSSASKPWYREPWPWILAAGPITVVVAGAITTAIAFSTADGLVADDYYKRGLAINRELARDRRADDLGLVADVRFDATSRRMQVAVAGTDSASTLPPSLKVSVIHPIRVADDRTAVLAASARGIYEGEIGFIGTTPARIVIESSEWRLAGTMPAGPSRLVTLRAEAIQSAVPIR